MGFYERAKALVSAPFTRSPEVKELAQSERVVPADTFGGSRKTDVPKDGMIGKPAKHMKLHDAMFRRYRPTTLLEILKNNHPDVSQAVWNFKIIGNSGYKARATLLDGVTEHKSGQKLIDDFLLRLDFYASAGYEKSKSLDKLVDELIDNALIRGATSIEMVMDRDYEDVLFITAVDPETISFESESGRLIPYQTGSSTGRKIRLDIPTFFYEGLDESVKDPYGTSPFISAIQTIAFHQQILDDLKAIIHNQGYGKYDIKIIEEVLLKRMPLNVKQNEAKKQEWLNGQLNMIIQMYQNLDPDAAFVHFDSVEASMIDAAKATVDPQKITAVIDAMMNNALKQFSTLMGRRSTGQTEQYAKMEIKIFMKSVQRIQKLIESMLSRALTKYLNINGMQGYVFFEFNDTEIRTELEKVNFEQIAIMNAANKRDQGWISQDEASEEVVGHKAVGDPDKEMLGVQKDDPQGAADERQPTDSSSSDSTGS
ncbi:hypothetical protein IAQ67_28375 (plasmid) [Paenibacillus peoriae]|uniref:Phage portal protein n=1 Tax=Paenibacillus peoriae TaxID=59893 RepID=A0A7H0YH77_9BACL|nr:hypothetical protein [Paenibacillus peoriae]QNR70435.1 hypothetical protein IAQ67_28375 [Paenibacillus peoriae]